MSKLQVTKTQMKDGIWRGIVTPATKIPPKIEVTHEGQVIEDVSIEKDPTTKEWSLRVSVPIEAITDGVQVLLIHDQKSNDVIGNITLMAGDVLNGDLRAELELLRAELDLLKAAFRRQAQKPNAKGK
ncbi:MAG: hypothetical protein AAF755_14220 [Pseudomonadota bacterium]